MSGSGKSWTRGPLRPVRLRPEWILPLLLGTWAAGCGEDGGGTGPDVEPPAGTPVLGVLTGDEQTDQAGATLWREVVVRVTNESGAAFPGVSVEADASGGGSVAPASAVSDAQGHAAFRWTLGDELGTQDLAFSATGAAPVQATAWALENLPAFDSQIEAFLSAWGVPGVGVAVALDGRLVYARGYGVADTGTGEEVKAEHRFRIASVSKPITAAAIMQMVERGDLDLEDAAFNYLIDLAPPEGATPDSRLADITIRDLLEHSGGWDRDVSYDPMFIPQQAADGVGAPAPASVETVIRFMLGQSLDFDPGARYAYSNFGYAVLGRVIESVSGMSYEDYMTGSFLAPMGITRMAVGRTRTADRMPEEVRYHDLRNITTQSVFEDGTVPVPYGGFHIEAMDAHGGWIASPVDLLRFATAVDGRADRGDEISAATVDEMIARPGLPDWSGSAFWYAKGWLVRPSGGDANWWHDGLLAGTTTCWTLGPLWPAEVSPGLRPEGRRLRCRESGGSPRLSSRSG